MEKKLISAVLTGLAIGQGAAWCAWCSRRFMEATARRAFRDGAQPVIDRWSGQIERTVGDPAKVVVAALFTVAAGGLIAASGLQRVGAGVLGSGFGRFVVGEVMGLAACILLAMLINTGPPDGRACAGTGVSGASASPMVWGGPDANPWCPGHPYRWTPHS